MARPQDGPKRNGRIGIPNIPTGAMPWYLIVFAVITAYLAASNTLTAIDAKNTARWNEIQYVVTGELIRAGAASLVVSPIIVETVRMVLAAIWSERRERKAREEGRVEGRAEGEDLANQRWSEWNRRRKQAEEQGEPFNEPEP